MKTCFIIIVIIPPDGQHTGLTGLFFYAPSFRFSRRSPSLHPQKHSETKHLRCVHMDLITTRGAFCVPNSPYVLMLALIGGDSLFCNRGTAPTCEWMIYVAICFVLIIIWLSLFVWWLSMSGSISLHAHGHTHRWRARARATRSHTCAAQRNFGIIEAPLSMARLDDATSPRSPPLNSF